MLRYNCFSESSFSSIYNLEKQWKKDKQQESEPANPVN